MRGTLRVNIIISLVVGILIGYFSGIMLWLSYLVAPAVGLIFRRQGVKWSSLISITAGILIGSSIFWIAVIVGTSGSPFHDIFGGWALAMLQWIATPAIVIMFALLYDFYDFVRYII